MKESVLLALVVLGLFGAGYQVGRHAVLRDPASWGHETLGRAYAKCRQRGGYLRMPFMGEPWRCDVSSEVRP